MSSRTEDILKSILDKEKYTGVPQSRVEELLIELGDLIEQGGVSPEQIEAAVDRYLDTHPVVPFDFTATFSTVDLQTFTCDKTFAEIDTAYKAGKNLEIKVLVLTNNVHINCTVYESSVPAYGAEFVWVLGGTPMVYSIWIDSNNTVSFNTFSTGGEDTEAREEIATVKADLNELSYYQTGKNILNPASVQGAIQSNGTVSTIGAWAGYHTFDYVPVKADVTYTYSVWLGDSLSSATRKLWLLFDENKTPISSTYQNVSGIQTFTFTPTVDGYIRITEYTQSSNPKPMLEVGSTYSDYQEYEYYRVINARVLEQNMPYGDRLIGKKWAVCGDSFSFGATQTKMTDGKYIGKNYVYPFIIGNKTNIEVLKFFASGQTLAYPADHSFTNSLTCPTAVNYYQNIPEDVDYITIYLGINDSHHAHGSSGGDGEDNTGVIPIGTIDDNTTDTFGGAYNVVLTWLMTNRPNAHIGIIVSNGVDSVDYRNLTIAIANKYGLPYIDLNGDERTPALIRSCNPNIPQFVKTILNDKWRVSPENYHPNDDAHTFESSIIEAFLRSL